MYPAHPPRQFHTKRRLATILYLVSIVGTLASAMALHSTILCLVFIVLQTAALLWWVVGRLEGQGSGLGPHTHYMIPCLCTTDYFGTLPPKTGTASRTCHLRKPLCSDWWGGTWKRRSWTPFSARLCRSVHLSLCAPDHVASQRSAGYVSGYSFHFILYCLT